MGIETKTVTIVTCDLCGSSRGKGDNFIDFAINGGDGRDVGPTRIQGRITLYQPYACSAGRLCRACTHHWLRRYLDNAAREGE